MTQKQKQAGDGSGSANDDVLARVKPVGPSFNPREELKMAGVKDMTDEQLAQMEDANPGKHYRAICCCGDSTCRIGPFTGVQEV